MKINEIKFEKQMLEEAEAVINSTPLGNNESTVFSNLRNGPFYMGIYLANIHTEIHKLTSSCSFDNNRGLYLFNQDIRSCDPKWESQRDSFLAYLVLDNDEYKNLEKNINLKLSNKNGNSSIQAFINPLSYCSHYQEAKEFDYKTPLVLAYSNQNGHEGFIGGDVHSPGSISMGKNHYGWEKCLPCHWAKNIFDGIKVDGLMSLAKRKALGKE